jgi:hypothetical protein
MASHAVEIEDSVICVFFLVPSWTYRLLKTQRWDRPDVGYIRVRIYRMWDVASIEGEKLYLAACGNSTEQPIGDFLMLTMTRYEDQSLWHGNVLRVLSSVVDCTFNPGYVERPSRWGLGGQYNSGFPASRCHISSRIFWRALFAIAPYP